ncbi:MAG: hypothetical protein KC561_17440 [Myxococcales bacterium]|nr:hypothetical protein [Myxococcales bacterium]
MLVCLGLGGPLSAQSSPPELRAGTMFLARRSVEAASVEADLTARDSLQRTIDQRASTIASISENFENAARSIRTELPTVERRSEADLSAFRTHLEGARTALEGLVADAPGLLVRESAWLMECDRFLLLAEAFPLVLEEGADGPLEPLSWAYQHLMLAYEEWAISSEETFARLEQGPEGFFDDGQCEAPCQSTLAEIASEMSCPEIVADSLRYQLLVAIHPRIDRQCVDPATASERCANEDSLAESPAAILCSEAIPVQDGDSP